MYAGGKRVAELSASATEIENSFPHTAHSHASSELLRRYTGISQRRSTACDAEIIRNIGALRAGLRPRSVPPRPRYEQQMMGWVGLGAAVARGIAIASNTFPRALLLLIALLPSFAP